MPVKLYLQSQPWSSGLILPVMKTGLLDPVISWAGARELGKVLAGSAEAGKGAAGWGGVGVEQTWLSSPRKMSMMKKRQDHSWDRGIMVTALGKAMKARPGPAGHTQHQGGPPARACARVCLPACAG